MRTLEQLLAKLLPIPVTFSHAKAHSGDPYNELVDVLANRFALGQQTPCEPPAMICQLVQHTNLTWIPTLFNGETLPLGGHGLCWDGTQPPGCSPLAPAQLIPTTGIDGQAQTAELQLKCFTLNAQSLSGKCRYYEDQLDELGCHVACFQETKGSEGLCTSKRFLRFSTNSDGHWGVAVWVSRIRGIFSKDGTPVNIREEDARVVHKSPRLMILSISTGEYKVVIASGHCPYAHRRDEAVEFLELLRQHLGPLKHSGIIVLGIDLNGRIPTNVADVTGSLAKGSPDDQWQNHGGHRAGPEYMVPGHFLPTSCWHLHHIPAGQWGRAQNRLHWCWWNHACT